MDIIANRASFIYDKILKNARNENLMKNTRTMSIANTSKYEPEFQEAENRSRNYIRTGNQKFEDPFKFYQKPYSTYNEGRNLDILNTLKYHQKNNYPELVSVNNLKVVGRY